MKVTKQKPKLTPQREAVFQVIQERDDHPTASDIFEAARRRARYQLRNRLQLVALPERRRAGLRNQFGDSASRYDRETDRHDHAICNDCGKLVDFDLPDAAKLMQAAARVAPNRNPFT